MASTKIYTRSGDQGKTSLIGGTRVTKDHDRLDAYGTVDELNSHLGVVRALMRREGFSAEDETTVKKIDELLAKTQSELFNVGSQLACEDDELRRQLPQVQDSSIADLEQAMDEYSTHLEPLKNFILPGGCLSAAHTHIARTVCRRAERLTVAISAHESVDDNVIKYLNRLSDYLFVLSRRLNQLLKIPEPIWKPHAP